MKKIKNVLIISLLVSIFQSCELERINPNDIEAADDIKRTNVLFYQYKIRSEQISNKIIDRNETVYLDIILKNYGGKKASGVKVNIKTIAVQGIWDIKQNVYSAGGYILAKNIGTVDIENPGLKFGLKFTAPNKSSRESLLLTITDDSGQETKSEMIVVVD
jgi:hypothetical protein